MASWAVNYNSNSSAVFKLISYLDSQLHGSFGAYIFSNLTQQWPSATNQSLAYILSSYYVSFAVTLDPNSIKAPNAPFWPSYVTGGAENSSNGESVGFTILGAHSTGPEVIPDPDANAKCDFFWAYSSLIAN